MASAKRGKRIGTKAPYGYKKHPDEQKQIVPNEDTAPIVQRIFSLCASGFGPDQIARMLKDEQVLTPTVYDFRTNGVRHRHLNEHKPFEWCGGTIAYILEHEEYIGTTVNCRSFYPSFKKKKSKQNPPEKWLRFENTHEPIIDTETWEIVQRVRAAGKRHYFCRSGSLSEEQYTYTCGTYHEHKEDCTPHTIKVMALHQIALTEIRRVTQDAKQHTDAFLARAMDKHQSGLKKELSAKMRECEKGIKRLTDLDKLFRKAFEEMTLEHLSNQQFQMLTQGYEVEKQDLSQRIALLEKEIATSQDKMLNSDRFLKLVDKYTDIQELTPELVRDFIDKIVVHERSEPRKKKNYTQQVDVHFNFVGRI